MFNFCWHKWAKWSLTIEGYGGSLHQVCECEKCGAIKRRRAVSMMVARLGADQVKSAVEDTLKEKLCQDQNMEPPWSTTHVSAHASILVADQRLLLSDAGSLGVAPMK